MRGAGLAVFDEARQEMAARGCSPGGAARAALERGLGAWRVRERFPGTWSLDAGSDAASLRPTGYAVTAASRDEAELGLLAIASTRRSWGRCHIVPERDVRDIMASVVA